MNRFVKLVTLQSILMGSSLAFGQVTSFTYQGQLKQAGVPVSGTFILDFSLWDADLGGNLVAGPLSRPNTQVTNGLFNVLLDFPPEVFTGARLWLEVIVDGVPLTPRQELTAVPYALHSAGPWVTNGQDISYTRGAVGVGTSTPVHPLDVAGDTKLRERLAVGNDAGFGISSHYDDWHADFDVSHVHTDFTTVENWSAFRSYITFDPNIDLYPHPGSPRSLFSHDFECFTPATNDHAYDYLQGPYLGAFHEGSGIVHILAGGSIVAQTTGTGSVDLQIGGYIASILGTGGEGTGTIQRNEGLEIITGNAGAAGASIVNDYSMYVYSPDHDQPMTNHYGIYLEDQDFGQNDSYAIYSAGGKNYLAGNLGIGINAPQTKLHIGGVAGVDGIMFPDGSMQTTAAGGGGVSGSGTTDTIPLWGAGTMLGNSLIAQSNGVVRLPNVVTLAVGAQGTQTSFGSPNGETGISMTGPSGRADLRFDGTTLRLFNGPAGTPPANGIAINASGNVGIGTTNPAAKLHVVGGDLVTGSTTGANIVMRDAEIQARFNGGPFGLVINNAGGDVVFGGAIDIGYEIVTTEGTDAICPAGKKVLGGGCAVFGGNQDIKHSYPANNGWHCDAGIDHDVGSTFYNLTSYAICARVK